MPNDDLVKALDTKALTLRDGVRVVDGEERYVVEIEARIKLPDDIQSQTPTEELLKVLDAWYAQLQKKLNYELFHAARRFVVEVDAMPEDIYQKIRYSEDHVTRQLANRLSNH